MANPTVPNEFLDDVVARRLQAFADELEQQLGPAARERGGTFAGEVWLLPARQDAPAVAWIDLGQDDELHLYVGTQGRWELDHCLEDVAFAKDIVRAIVAGRVREVLAPGRARIIVTMADGTTVRETGHDALVGRLPLPGWGREVRYAPATIPPDGGSPETEAVRRALHPGWRAAGVRGGKPLWPRLPARGADVPGRQADAGPSGHGGDRRWQGWRIRDYLRDDFIARWPGVTANPPINGTTATLAGHPEPWWKTQLNSSSTASRAICSSGDAAARITAGRSSAGP